MILIDIWQKTPDLITFSEENFNGRVDFLRSATKDL